MARLLKIIIGVFLTIIFLVVALPFLMNWNNYKPDIQKIVAEKTGRQLTIDGDIGLRLLPTPQATIEKARLSNLKGAKSENFVSVEEVQVQLALLPLLSKQVKVTALTIDQPKVWLETLADGRASWQLAPEKSADKTPLATDQEAVDGGNKQPAVALSLDAVQVNDATIVYQDYKAAEPFQLSNLSAFIQAPSLQGPFNLKGELTAKDLPIEWQLGVAEFKKGEPITLTLNSKIANGILLDFDGVVKQGDQPSLRGKLGFNLADYANLKAISKDLNIPAGLTGGLALTSEVFANKSGVAFDPMTVKTMGFNLPSKLQYKFASTPQLYANVQGFPGASEFEVFANSVGGANAFDGKIGFVSGSISKALDFFGQKLPAPLSGVNKVVVSTDLKISGAAIAAKDLHVSLDDTKMTGALSLDRVGGQSDLMLRSSNINLDKLSSGRGVEKQPAASGKVASTGSNSVPAAKAEGIQLPAFLANGQHAFDVKLDRLQKDGAVWKDVVAKGRLHNGELVLKTASLANQDGLRAEASGTVKSLATSPVANLEFVAHHPTNGGVSAKGKLNGWTDKLSLDSTIQAPSADLNGVVKGDVTLGQNKTIDALIQLKALDLDLLKKLQGQKQAASQTSAGTAVGGGSTTPAKQISAKPFLPSDWSGEVDIEVQKLVSQHINLQDLKATAKLANQVLNISDLAADADSGRLTGQVTVDGKTAIPDYQISVNTSQLDLAKALWKSDLPVTGILDSSFNFTGKGLDKDSVLNSLTGGGDFKLQDGQLHGVDLPALNDRLHNITSDTLLSTLLTRDIIQGSTRFQDLIGKVQVNKGILSLGQTKLTSDKAIVDADGSVSLSSKVMDVKTRVQLPEHPKLPPIGLQFKGNVTKPNITLDINALQKYYGAKAIDKVIDKGLEKLFDKKKTQPPAAQPVVPDAEGAATEQSQQDADPKQDVEDALKGLLKRAIQ